MHECVVCGMQCDCDGEDLDQPAPLNCSCSHEGSGLDELGLPLEEEEWDEADTVS